MPSPLLALVPPGAGLAAAWLNRTFAASSRLHGFVRDFFFINSSAEARDEKKAARGDLSKKNEAGETKHGGGRRGFLITKMEVSLHAVITE